MALLVAVALLVGVAVALGGFDTERVTVVGLFLTSIDPPESTRIKSSNVKLIVVPSVIGSWIWKGMCAIMQSPVVGELDNWLLI